MNKQKLIKILKIVAVVFWVVLLLAPTIYGTVDVVTMKDYDETYDIETDTHNFEVYVDKEVVEGTVTIGFYDEDDTLLSSVEIPFEKNKGTTVEVSLADKDIHADATKYDIIDMEVKTQSLKTLEAVLYPVAILYVIAMVAVLRINYANATVEGKDVEVYSGVFKQTLKVDGEVVAQEKKMFISKPISLMATLENGTNVLAQIDAKNRISIYSQEQQKQETPNEVQTVEQPEVIEEPVVKQPEEPVVETTETSSEE